MTTRMDAVTRQARQELDAVRARLVELRTERDALAGDIRNMVREEQELISVISKLTPRTRKPSDAVAVDDAPGVDEA